MEKLGKDPSKEVKELSKKRIRNNQNSKEKVMEMLKEEFGGSEMRLHVFFQQNLILQKIEQKRERSKVISIFKDLKFDIHF